MEMTSVNEETFSRIDIPQLSHQIISKLFLHNFQNSKEEREEGETYATSSIIAPTNNLIPTRLDTPHTILMTG